MKKKTFFTLGIALSVLVPCGIAFSQKSTRAFAAEWTGENLKTSYAYGEELRIPQKSATVGGESKIADAVVVFPDGTSYCTDTVVLNQSGKYTLTYTASVANRVYSEKYEFDVENKLFVFANANTSVEYQTFEGLVAVRRRGCPFRLQRTIRCGFANISTLTLCL